MRAATYRAAAATAAILMALSGVARPATPAPFPSRLHHGELLAAISGGLGHRLSARTLRQRPSTAMSSTR